VYIERTVLQSEQTSIQRYPLKWRILYVRARFEKKIEKQLLDMGIKTFLPLREVLRQWTDRRKKVVVPLFPSYIFVHVNERQRIKTLDVFGTVKYVQFSGKLAEVRPDIIESIRIAVDGPARLNVVSTQLKPGASVKVMYGPLAGMRGNLVEYRGSKKVAIILESIQQALVVEVSSAYIAEDCSGAKESK